MKTLLVFIAYIILVPLIGGLLAGLDRIITARMQSRVGPSIFQSFYDVFKLLKKENLVVRRSQNFYMLFYLIVIIFTGALFFTGGDLLLVVFAFALADIFFVLGGFKSSSPYSFVGAQRELIQMAAFDPMELLAVVGMYMVTNSFYALDIIKSDKLLFLYLPGLFIGFIIIACIKFRKSPFDLSTSHHAHQELVKGITTEFSGKTLALIEIGHWFESMLVLGFIFLFFSHNWIIGILMTLVVYFIVILIDNVFARIKWQMTLFSVWALTLILGVTNIIVLYLFKI
ncbi:MAG: respiratory-chain NADH dehydrogenase subunit 1 [uncultured bacterium]|nr:MAG: respiratory-chain NADH dehydrogenase subunit 1 [uncultured bacterium]